MHSSLPFNAAFHHVPEHAPNRSSSAKLAASSIPFRHQWQIELQPAIHQIDVKGVIRQEETDLQDVDEAIGKLLVELAANNGE